MEVEEPAYVDDIDPYEISDPVDIFKKFNEKWTQKVIAGKWKEKKNDIELFLKAAKRPKLAYNNGVYPIISMVKKLLKDSHFIVNHLALHILLALAKGLRKNFTRHAVSLTATVLQKLKEKKV